jgi:Copper amine oxidase N-terminal domain
MRKMFKKYFVLYFAFALITSFMSVSYANADTAKLIEVYMEGGRINFETAPIIKNNRTFVEMRPIFTEADIKLHWDQSTQTVTGIKDNTTIKLTLGSKTAYINGKAVQLDAAPFAKNNYTFVPLRFVGEATGYKVDWHSSFNLIHIHEGKAFIEDRAFTKKQLTTEMLETLREGRFPDFPVSWDDNIGVLLDTAGTPKIFRPGIPETEAFEQWMYGDYWFKLNSNPRSIRAIIVEPARTTFTVDEVLDALGPAENMYKDDYHGYTIHAYYEGSYMYEFRSNDEGEIISISLQPWNIY